MEQGRGNQPEVNSYGTDDPAEQARIEEARVEAHRQRQRDRDRHQRYVEASINPEDAEAIIEIEDSVRERRAAANQAPEAMAPSPETTPEREQRPAPRIYVRSLVDYNQGHLIGDWIHADQDVEDIQANILAILARSLHTHWTGEPSEEWAIHDHEGFGSVRLHEHESLDLVSKLAKGIAEHGLAYAAWAEINDLRDTATLDQFREAYLGAYDSREAWAMDVTEQTGLVRILAEAAPEQWVQFVQIDFEAIAHEAETSGDIRFVDHPGGVWVFDGRL